MRLVRRRFKIGFAFNTARAMCGCRVESKMAAYTKTWKVEEGKTGGKMKIEGFCRDFFFLLFFFLAHLLHARTHTDINI